MSTFGVGTPWTFLHTLARSVGFPSFIIPMHDKDCMTWSLSSAWHIHTLRSLSPLAHSLSLPIQRLTTLSSLSIYSLKFTLKTNICGERSGFHYFFKCYDVTLEIPNFMCATTKITVYFVLLVKNNAIDELSPSHIKIYLEAVVLV